MLKNVSVIIVNWNKRDLLAECLQALQKQTYRSFSVIVVDNGSVDGSVEYVKVTYPHVSLIPLPENYGFCIANNIALRSVQSKYVALLNNDAVPGPFWLQRLVDCLEECPEAGFAASKMLFSAESGIIDRAGDAYTRAGAASLRGRGCAAESFDAKEWIFGACAGAALYRMEMLQDIGFFDEDFFLLYEDVDLSFRAQLRGYRCIYVPDAVVYHKGSSSIINDSPVSVYYGHRNLEWTYLKNMPSALIRKSILFHGVYIFIAFLFFVSRKRGWDYCRAKLDALKCLRHMLKKRSSVQSRKCVADSYLWNLMQPETFIERAIRRLKK